MSSSSSFRFSFAFLRRGLQLPPGGWVLAALLAFYVIAGLVGRDPWKGEDAIHINVAWQMLSTGQWLVPKLAGQFFYEPPLYYWSAALSGALFGGWFALHDAIRLASGFWIALALVGQYYAGRELYGQDSAAASPLLLAGCVGLTLHAHDAQPLLIALTAYTGALGGLAALGRKPHLTGLFYGLALAACLLGAGIAPTLPLLALAPLACYLSPRPKHALLSVLIALALASVLIAPWFVALSALDEQYLNEWLRIEWEPLTAPFSLSGVGQFMGLLPWFAFPVLPLALWTLWLRRRQWREAAVVLPLALWILTSLLLAWVYRPRELPALLLLPSLALLATPGVLALKRGAHAAFDWFAITCFSLFGGLVWLCWSAMMLGWPARLSARVFILRPGFAAVFDGMALLLAIVATLAWLWLITTAPRSPYRSLTHWTLGLTIFWLTATTLIMPWFDYGKSYRPVAEAIDRHLPAANKCWVAVGLTDTQRASLSYFIGINPLSTRHAAADHCPWWVSVGDSNLPANTFAQPLWEGRRAGGRREIFRLYQRPVP